MVSLPRAVGGRPFDADDYNQVPTLVEDHDDRLLAVEMRGRVAGNGFGTDLVSTGTTEVVGYSQSVTLVSGRRYKVWFKGLMNAATAGNVAVVRVRYSTETLSTSSTLADSAQFVHSAAGSPGRGTLTFFAEFTAPSSGTFNVGVGVATVIGTGNETIVGSANTTVISVDDVT